MGFPVNRVQDRAHPPPPPERLPAPRTPQQCAWGRPFPLPHSRSSEPAGPSGRRDKEMRGSRGGGRRGRALSTGLPRRSTNRFPMPAKHPPPRPEPFLAPGPLLGPARRGVVGRPPRAGAEEGAAAATMSARPSQKRGAQRTMRGGGAGGAGGAGAQADPADPRGISGARSPGNPAP